MRGASEASARSTAPDVAGLARILADATARLAGAGVPITILFSGGLDSSVLAWILRTRPATELLTIGREGTQDLLAAQAVSAEIGLPWRARILTAEEIRDGARRWFEMVGPLREPERSVQLSLALAFESAGTRYLLLGQGADELFWGYARFRRADPWEAERLARLALEKLLSSDLPLTQRVAAACGRELLLPYLEMEVRAFVGTFSADAHCSPEESKPLLRKVARELGVPSAGQTRAKRAIQYGTGIARVLERTR
ncbi:MAG: asparagine synthase C-terminal domain-containing protein [Thermoplasmata archaeon]|nr:asparagine synthase C-terminal domain-containing protein [Thermoplasmata archaeon]